MLFWVVSRRLRAKNQPYPTPFPGCIPSILDAPSHVHFYFLNSLSLSTIYRFIGIFSQDAYFPLLFLKWYTYTPLNPHPEFLVFTNPTSTFVTLLLNSSFPVSLFVASVTHPSLYVLSRWRENKKNTYITHTDIQHLREIRSVSRQSGDLIDGNDWKQETCNGKRDPFTFIW